MLPKITLPTTYSCRMAVDAKVIAEGFQCACSRATALELRGSIDSIHGHRWTGGIGDIS